MAYKPEGQCLVKMWLVYLFYIECDIWTRAEQLRAALSSPYSLIIDEASQRKHFGCAAAGRADTRASLLLATPTDAEIKIQEASIFIVGELKWRASRL